ncbi:MAG: tRNA-uridine aminocarboxypropyltransferase [Bacteriovoracia bacterium]
MPKPRCERCFLHTELCLCADIPSFALSTRVVLLMHAQEAEKPTNTGRLAHLCLPNSEIRLRGLRMGPPLSLEGLVDDTHESWMLYLSPESEALTPELVARTAKPIRLLVPDGTWSQASSLGAKLVKKLPGVKHIKLISAKPSMYRLRSEHHPDGMATFEAIARTLGVIHGAAVQEKMEHIFRVMTDRMLWTRGQLPAREVVGGIPGKK